MKSAQIEFASCQACSPCDARKACRTKAIVKMGPDEQAIVMVSDCMGCGDCIEACPFGAISMKET
ncbi:MAG: 4Fe-4S binding protein [Thermoleophilia bacterium]